MVLNEAKKKKMWRSTSRPSRLTTSDVVAGDHARKPFFNPSEDYEDKLNKMRADFNHKFENHKPSPNTNLIGFEQKIVLGSGSFGTVKLVRHIDSNRYYAVKTMLKSSIVRIKKVHHILSEKRILQAIQFPTLISLDFSSKDNDYLYLGLPVVSGGELYTYHRKVKKFNEKQARFYAVQIALGFEYLHHLKVLYRDLKLENVLIDLNGYIKLTDFGFAKKVDYRTATLCGTPEYLPPEVIKSIPYGNSVDWWCFGVFVYEMVAGQTPFFETGIDVMTMYQKICDCDYRLPGYFSQNLKDLIQSFLEIDVSKRLGCQISGCKDIKHHDWFRGIDWFAILNQEVNAPYVPTVTDVEDVTNFHTEISRTVPKSEVNRFSEIFSEF